MGLGDGSKGFTCASNSKGSAHDVGSKLGVTDQSTPLPYQSA